MDLHAPFCFGTFDFGRTEKMAGPEFRKVKKISKSHTSDTADFVLRSGFCKSDLNPSWQLSPPGDHNR